MKKIAQIFLLATAIASIINGCRKDESNGDVDPGTSSSSQVHAIITGIVTDENSQPVIGAVVVAGTLSTTTDHYGNFFLNGNVTKSRCLITFTKAGYLNRIHGIIPNENTVNYVRIVLGDEPTPQLFNSTTGGTIPATSGGSITFPVNAIVIDGTTTPYSGSVSVISKHLAPGSINFGLMVPGGDLLGKNTAGGDVVLYTYGMTGATLRGSGGELLQLASGSTATITFPIAGGQINTAPATIPLWYLDETTGLWKEEGTATKVGNNYVGTVAHFSWWNCDYQGNRASISGRVVDCEGIPLANITVTVNGSMTLTTDGNGNYTNWVPSGIALTFQVLPQGVIVLPSQVENVAPLSSGQNFTVPDLVVPCGSYIVGILEGCNQQVAEGWVGIYQNGIMQNSVYTTTGSFRLLVPSSTNVTLYAGSPSGVLTQMVTTVGMQDSLDAGTLTLCNYVPDNSPFSFVMDGMGNNNVLVYTYFVSTLEAHYRPTWDYTNCNLYGTSNLGASSMSLNFEGNQPVNLDINMTQDSSFHIQIANDYFFPKQGGSNHFYVEVTHYGNVGDSIKGTFHGQLVTWSDTTGIIVSNGKFAFIRGQDQ
ncbi:hypothetical protein BH11BAC1_BH11BAC1_20910 [soil metagenome]